MNRRACAYIAVLSLLLLSGILRPAPARADVSQSDQTASPARSTLSGTVTGRSDGEVLIGAHVHVLGIETGTTTNEYGFYSLSFPAADSVTIVYSYT
ncbi:MAG: hypothetical protein HKN17_07370, partial [Rhodothermales bacterium]|nr:hypothetical protein [Rhodothermales bacterium]